MSADLASSSVLPVIIAVLELAATARYLRAVLRGATRPCRTTWLIWAPLAWLTVASSIEAGACATLAKLVASALGVSGIALLSLWHGTGGRTPADLACFALTAVGVELWAALQAPGAGLCLFLAADLIGALPTVCQAWRDPRHEAVDPWLLGLLGAALNLTLVDDAAWNATLGGFALWGYPIYLTALNGVMVALTLAPGRHVAAVA